MLNCSGGFGVMPNNWRARSGVLSESCLRSGGNSILLGMAKVPFFVGIGVTQSRRKRTVDGRMERFVLPSPRHFWDSPSL